MRFRVIGKDHRSGDRVFVKGDIIETNEDLCARFVGKFEKLSTPVAVTEKAPEVKKTLVAPIPPPAEEEKKPKPLFTHVPSEIPAEEIVKDPMVIMTRTDGLFDVKNGASGKLLNVDGLTMVQAQEIAGVNAPVIAPPPPPVVEKVVKAKRTKTINPKNAKRVKAK